MPVLHMFGFARVAILLTEHFIGEAFTGGVLLTKPLLKKFYWRSFTEEILLENLYWGIFTGTFFGLPDIGQIGASRNVFMLI